MRRQTLISALVLVFVLSAITSAGIIGVMATVQTQAGLTDNDATVPGQVSAPSPLVADVENSSGGPSGSDVVLAAADDSDLSPAENVVAADAFQVDGIPVRLTRVSRGRVEPAERADLQLINNGQVLGVQPVGQGGVVQWDISEGIYSFLARGADGFATGRAPLLLNGQIPEFGLIPWVDMPVVEPVLERDVYAGGTRANLGGPVQADGWENILYGADFVVNADGMVHGRVTKTEAIDAAPLAIVGCRVLFIRAGRIVGQGITDERGEFQIAGMQPGVHTFLAASNLGLLAISTEIHPQEAPAPGVVSNQPRAEIRFVQGGIEASADPAPPEDIQAGGGTGAGVAGQGPGEMGMGPMGGAGGGMGGGSGGGSGGGGVGGGGGGLLSALLGGALGAGLGWLAGDEAGDDDPVSP